MDQNVLIELIKVGPTVIGFILLGLFALWYRNPIVTLINTTVTKVSNVKAFGIEVSLATSEIEEAYKSRGISFDHVSCSVLRNRIESLVTSKVIRAVWIDDNPANNFHERAALASIGVLVDTVTTSTEALKYIASERYNLLLSDVARNGKSDAGIQFLKQLVEKENVKLPTIFYVGSVDQRLGVPPYAFGITDSPSELLHLVLDFRQRMKP